MRIPNEKLKELFVRPAPLEVTGQTDLLGDEIE
jgi:hypothetical protein